MGAMMNYQQQQNNLVQTQSPQPTGQQQYNPNGARGPLAPVASNEALLNPMMPQQTGMFVPTRGSPAGQQQQQQQMSPMATGMMPQQTGFMMPQATGYAAGFQQGYGMQASESRSLSWCYTLADEQQRHTGRYRNEALFLRDWSYIRAKYQY